MQAELDPHASEANSSEIGSSGKPRLDRSLAGNFEMEGHGSCIRL
jgi:hypothetical protein